MSQEIRFPEIKGRVCRALPYEKDQKVKYDSNACIFVKGFGHHWTHKDLYSAFEQFGEIVSTKVSITEKHEARGYGFIQFEKDHSAKEAIEQVRKTTKALTNSIWIHMLYSFLCFRWMGSKS